MISAGVLASSKTPYGYDFYGNEPLAWWDYTLADSTDIDGSNRVSAWRSRWTPASLDEDWTLTQGTASKQPLAKSASDHSGYFQSGADETPARGGSMDFDPSNVAASLHGGSDTDRHIDSPLVIIAMYQRSYGTSSVMFGQYNTAGDFSTDKNWYFGNINHAQPKENRILWAVSPGTGTYGADYAYETNWCPGTYNNPDNLGTKYDHVGAGWLPSDTNKARLYMKDLTTTDATAYPRLTSITHPIHLGESSGASNKFDGYITEVLLFDGDTTKWDDTKILALMFQIAKRHGLDATNNAAGKGY